MADAATKTGPTEPFERGNSLWSDAWRRLKKNRLALVCAGLLVVVAIGGYGAPIIAANLTHFSYDEQHTRLAYAPPGTRDISLDHISYDGDTTSFEYVDLDGDGFLSCIKIVPPPVEGVVWPEGEDVSEVACPEIDELNRVYRHFEFLFDRYDIAVGDEAPDKLYPQPDGFITWKEFPQTEAALKPTFRGRGLSGEAAFGMLDRDKDGTITLDEVTVATRILRFDKIKLLEEYDADGDLRISRAEYPGAPQLHTFVFGLDGQGRDVMTRILYGGRISITIGLITTLIAFLIGITYGSIAGFFGGAVDNIMMRIVDVLYGLPYLFIIILLLVTFGRSTLNLFIALGALNWLNMARIVRGQVISLKTREFVEAARAIGVPPLRIVFRHLIRNTVGPVVVYATLMVPGVILQEAFLSFLGLGVQPPEPSWGNMITEGANKFQDFEWLIIFPGLALALTLFSMNFLGDGVRDAMDPQMQKA